MGERPGGRYLRDPSGPPLACVCGPHMAATVGTMPCGMQRPVMQLSRSRKGTELLRREPEAAERDLEEEDASDPKKEGGVKTCKRSWPNVSRVSKGTARRTWRRS